MKNSILGFIKVFDPEQKCEKCQRLGFGDLFIFFFKGGKKKILHSDCL